MADILTQIQDELDHLLHQMASIVGYIEARAPPSVPAGQPILSSIQEHNASQAAAAQLDPSQSQPAIELPVTPQQLQTDMKELSKDLVLKEQQLELLVGRLPGIGSSEAQQVERMRELERQLEELEGARRRAVEEKEELVRRVEGEIMRVSGLS